MVIVLAHKLIREIECGGIIIALERADGMTDLICNECGQRIQTEIAPGEVERKLASLAGDFGYSAFPCIHCGVLNICAEVAFSPSHLTCPRCGAELLEAPVRL
jgi:transcription elongation factor Elf1